MKLKQKIFLVVIFFLVLANVFVWQEIFKIDGKLKVIFFSVGEGDSIFIETPEGHQILIDGGPSGKTILEKLESEIPFWDRTIDMAILTHPDADHLAGLNFVLQRYKVENIIWNGGLKSTETFKNWEKNLVLEKQEGSRIFIAQKGGKARAGEAQFYIFYPFLSLDGEIIDKKSNESSIILKLVFGKNSFLFLGDVSKKQEEELLVRSDFEVSPKAEVLKIAHHGSKTSSSEKLLEIVEPDFAVISVGKNSYNHPHPEVLQSLENFGIDILRTDELGDIKIVSDKENFKIN